MLQKKESITTTLRLLLVGVIFCMPVFSSEEIKDHLQQISPELQTPAQNSLGLAREQLGNAFDAYRKGDIEITKKHLDNASEWLQQSLSSSKSEKTRAEIGKLALEIESFKTRIGPLREEERNSLARLWHRATSIIKREAEQLIQDYVDVSNAEKMLKHLLDAKMHFFTAEHDLFVSHNATDTDNELARTLDYLKMAIEIPIPSQQQRIRALSSEIQSLRENLTRAQDSWINDSVVQALDKALIELSAVDANAAPAFQLGVESIQADIRRLRLNVARENIRNKYESAMMDLRSIINEL